MVRRYYDRYTSFRINNEIKVLPFIKIQKRASDIVIGYRKNKTRLDIVSNTYYGVPYYGWLILSANPQYGGLEFDIPDNAEIRVPFPLISALQDYEKSVKDYDVLYSIKT